MLDRREPPPGKIFVKGLDAEFTSEQFELAFAKYGRIKEVYLPKDKDSNGDRNRGFGFITFESPADADDAVKGMDGKDLNGHELHCEEASKPPRRDRVDRGPRGGGGGGGSRGFRGGGGGPPRRGERGGSPRGRGRGVSRGGSRGGGSSRYSGRDDYRDRGSRDSYRDAPQRDYQPRDSFESRNYAPVSSRGQRDFSPPSGSRGLSYGGSGSRSYTNNTSDYPQSRGYERGSREFDRGTSSRDGYMSGSRDYDRGGATGRDYNRAPSPVYQTREREYPMSRETFTSPVSRDLYSSREYGRDFTTSSRDRDYTSRDNTNGRDSYTTSLTRDFDSSRGTIFTSNREYGDSYGAGGTGRNNGYDRGPTSYGGSKDYSSARGPLSSPPSSRAPATSSRGPPPRGPPSGSRGNRSSYGDRLSAGDRDGPPPRRAGSRDEGPAPKRPRSDALMSRGPPPQRRR